MNCSRVSLCKTDEVSSINTDVVLIGRNTQNATFAKYNTNTHVCVLDLASISLAFNAVNFIQ